jgi:hypothetical protein
MSRLLMLTAAVAMLWSGASVAGSDVKIDIGLGVPPIFLTAPPPVCAVLCVR